MNAPPVRIVPGLAALIALSAFAAHGAATPPCEPGGLAGQGPRAVVGIDDARFRIEARRDGLRAALAPGYGVAAMANDPVAVPRLKLRAGELVSATGKSSSTLRLVLNGKKARVKSAGLSEDFVPRNVDYSAELGLVAIAAVSKIILYDPALGLMTVIGDLPGRDDFAFVNDVLFVPGGRLLIADMGEMQFGNLPHDGAIWEYDIAGDSFQEIALKGDLSNPSELELDARDRVLVIDAEGGPEIAAGLGLHSDAVYRLTGAAKNAVRKVYFGPGIFATAFEIAPDGTRLIGNLSEIVILDDEPVTACPCGDGFEFITGLAAGADGTLFVMDGSDTKKNKRTLYEISPFCMIEERLTGARIGGARGLDLVSGS